MVGILGATYEAEALPEDAELEGKQFLSLAHTPEEDERHCLLEGGCAL
jgi:hypothetical protein